MREGAPVSMGLPRPGPALKAVLVAVAVVGIGVALLNHALPVAAWLDVRTDRVLHGEVWRLLTAGLLTGSISHLFMTLIGLYFLSPDLERRWGPARFVRFLGVSVVVGYALAVALDKLAPLGIALLHPPMMFGAMAAITATSIAWSRENAELEVRLFFILPVKGKQLFWLTIAYCVLMVIYSEGSAEGVVAPFGGVLVGILLGGTPSTVRAAYLRAKLAFLKQKGGLPSRVAMQRQAPRRPRASGSPPLRVVHGGLEEELRKRQPPKDKRYLN